MLSRLTPKENLIKINNVKTGNDFHKKLSAKNLPRTFSSNNFSKDSTLYKTKNRLLSSLKFDRFKKNKNKSMILSRKKRSTFYPKNFKTLSLSAKNIFNKSSDKVDNRSYFMRKLGGEKKYLSYFDIQRILFLEKKVYKPDIEFEKKIYDLKNNNTDEFISNFNLDNYEQTILLLFQKHVSIKNYEIMKRNFEAINKAWKQRSRSTTRLRRITKIPTSATEREMKYNQLKKERAERIREKYSRKEKE